MMKYGRIVVWKLILNLEFRQPRQCKSVSQK